MNHNRGLLSLGLALIVGLFHGLVYVFIVPPWQHYDEPNHFEYVWLVANWNKIPKPGDFDPVMSREVVQSMIAHHFYDGWSANPDVNSTDQPVRITGYSQLGDPPLYYVLASLPLRLMRDSDIDVQLYVARLVSLLLYLISILAAWGMIAELTSPNNDLRWFVPLTLALWPGYTDMMTAINNDVGAVVVFSLFLWGGIRLIKKGFSWLVLLWTALAAAASFWTKQSVYVALPLFLVVLVFSLLRGRWRWLAWGCLLVGGLAGLALIFSWGDAFLWYRDTSQAINTRVSYPAAPLGKSVFQLETSPDSSSSQLAQLIPPSTGRELKGKVVTLGAWMWATRPMEARSPILNDYDGFQSFSRVFSVDENPTFHAITVTLSENANRTWIVLTSPARLDGAGTKLFFDGLVLAEGEHPIDQPPVFDGAYGDKGTWGGIAFTNIIRNPSAESSGPRLRLWADLRGRRLFVQYSRPSMILYSAMDWPGAGWYFQATAANMLRTFWARFGWGHVPLLGHKPYRVLLAVTLAGILGFMAVLWRVCRRGWRAFPWGVAVLLGIAFTLIVGLAVARGVFNLWFRPFIPSARYIYPVVIPIVVVLCTGWWEILSQLGRWLRVPSKILAVIYFTLFIILDVYSLVSIAHYYFG